MSETIRDRIKELRRVPAGELRPHPDNWRTHPERQQTALREMLAAIGYAQAVVAYEPEPGVLQLIDGHLRAELDPTAEIPVLVLDVNEDEARQLLLTLDPLAALAETDREALAVLLETTELPAAADAMILELAAAASRAADETAEQLDDEDDDEPEDPTEVEIPEAFQVVAACSDEAAQRELFERLTAEGYRCKLLTT